MAKGTILVLVHCNTFGDPSVRCGTQIWFGSVNLVDVKMLKCLAFSQSLAELLANGSRDECITTQKCSDRA